MLTVGSVCSGYGGSELAFSGLAEPVFMSEIAEFPRALLRHRFPDIPLHEDFTSLIADPPTCDILAGGTPCQAFSLAGNRKSLEDARGNLTLAFVMLLDAIDGKRNEQGLAPATCLWENVPGIFTVKDNAFGCFLGALVGQSGPILPTGKRGKWPKSGLVIGPRRAAAWRTLDAQYFGVPQRRRRVFVVASARDGFDPGAILFESESLPRNSASGRKARKDVTGTLASRANGGGGLGTDFELAGGLVEAPCSTIVSSGRGWWAESRVGACLRDQDSITKADTPLSVLPSTFSNASFGAYRESDGAREIAVIAFTCKDYGADAGDVVPTLRAMGHGESHANGGGQVTVYIQAETLALRGREGGATAELGGPTATALRASTGGGDKPHVLITKAYGGHNQSGPITVATALNACASASGRLDFESETFITQNMRVRRLMPIECERLQGLPDNWTQIPWKNEPAERCPDGHRYKAIGNGWAIPVVRWIAARLVSRILFG